jgi:hypothetical protein
MRLILANHVIRKIGDRRMFLRMKDTSVSTCYFFDDDYTESESVIIIQCFGSPSHDSGFEAQRFPATLEGLKKAHTVMESYETEEK